MYTQREVELLAQQDALWADADRRARLLEACAQSMTMPQYTRRGGENGSVLGAPYTTPAPKPRNVIVVSIPGYVCAAVEPCMTQAQNVMQPDVSHLLTAATRESTLFESMCWCPCVGVCACSSMCLRVLKRVCAHACVCVCDLHRYQRLVQSKRLNPQACPQETPQHQTEARYMGEPPTHN